MTEAILAVIAITALGVDVAIVALARKRHVKKNEYLLSSKVLAR